MEVLARLLKVTISRLLKGLIKIIINCNRCMLQSVSSHATRPFSIWMKLISRLLLNRVYGLTQSCHFSSRNSPPGPGVEIVGIGPAIFKSRLPTPAALMTSPRRLLCLPRMRPYGTLQGLGRFCLYGGNIHVLLLCRRRHHVSDVQHALSAMEYRGKARTLLEIRVLQVFFSNTYNKPLP
jgi:hypothetical protein